MERESEREVLRAFEQWRSLLGVHPGQTSLYLKFFHAYRSCTEERPILAAGKSSGDEGRKQDFA